MAPHMAEAGGGELWGVMFLPFVFLGKGVGYAIATIFTLPDACCSMVFMFLSMLARGRSAAVPVGIAADLPVPE